MPQRFEGGPRRVHSGECGRVAEAGESIPELVNDLHAVLLASMGAVVSFDTLATAMLRAGALSPDACWQAV
eukprot:1456859-Alexandrium_andersonii.AAC.1